MLVEINDKEYEGIAVIEDATKLEIKAKFKDNGDLVRIKTCHRSIDIEQAWKKRPFGWVDKDKAKLKLNLNSPIESNGNCPIEIIAFSHSGKHSWFFMTKKTDKENLPAIYKCDGETKPYNGAGICQSFYGLEQQIEFQEPVNVRSNCEIERIDESAFRYKTTKGHCIYSFLSETGKIHRLVTFGYEAIKLKK